jgi:hypothetical protein
MHANISLLFQHNRTLVIRRREIGSHADLTRYGDVWEMVVIRRTGKSPRVSCTHVAPDVTHATVFTTPAKQITINCFDIDVVYLADTGPK